MPDREWLANLATARIERGALVSSDPAKVRQMAASRIEDALFALRGEAEEAAAVYNDVAGLRLPLRVLSVGREKELPFGRDESRGNSASASQNGFILLCGKAQITVHAVPAANGGPRLDVQLSLVKDFSRKVHQTVCFVPHVDAFGTVIWSQATSEAGSGLLMTAELIMKRLLEELVRAALEA